MSEAEIHCFKQTLRLFFLEFKTWHWKAWNLVRPRFAKGRIQWGVQSGRVSTRRRRAESRERFFWDWQWDLLQWKGTKVTWNARNRFDFWDFWKNTILYSVKWKIDASHCLEYYCRNLFGLAEYWQSLKFFVALFVLGKHQVHLPFFHLQRQIFKSRAELAAEVHGFFPAIKMNGWAEPLDAFPFRQQIWDWYGRIIQRLIACPVNLAGKGQTSSTSATPQPTTITVTGGRKMSEASMNF